ncbi:hypothetical protein [Micromonospora sp. NPDC047730]|uniref:hypothetical protein n=1 Tax=Micromonospora sp. NPDC047730 TaxID=3364253 RepID=UPI00372253DB
MDESTPLMLAHFEVSDRFDGDDELHFYVVGSGPRYLGRSDVERLRDHLTALLGDGAEPSGPTAAAPVEVGKEYRLLPDSRYVTGASSVFVDDRTTCVRVVRGRDGDGDVLVSAMDGDDPGFTAHVDPKYLAPLDDPIGDVADVIAGKASVADIAQAAREVASRLGCAGLPVSDDIANAFTHFADLLSKEPS